MAGGKTQYLERAVIDHTHGKTAYTMPTVYIGLLTAAPTDTTAGTEATGGSYARKSTAAGDWAAASSAAPATSSNLNPITFVTATGSWGTVTHFAHYDAASAGNMLRFGSLTTSKTISSGDTASFAASSLTTTED
jgi:hypothetical protein